MSAANLIAPGFLQSAVARQFQPGVMEPGPVQGELARYLVLGVVAYLPIIATLHAAVLLIRRRSQTKPVR